MPKYEVKRPVKLDGEIHKPGCDPLELDAKTAAPLLESGSLAEAADAKPAAGNKAGGQAKSTGGKK